MPAQRLVYENANELKHAAPLHTALDYRRANTSHIGLHDIYHVRHTQPVAVIGAATAHTVRQQHVAVHT